LLAKEQEEQRRSLENPLLYARIVGLDADRWEVTRFSLWAKEDPLSEGSADCVQTYKVLEVCEGEDGNEGIGARA
jgi:hypothetical protein